MTYEEIVEKVRKRLDGVDPNKVDGFLAIQVNITGEGKLDPVVAFTLGKLKIEGNVEKVLEFGKLL